MFERIKLHNELKRLQDKYFFLLPTGLYLYNNKKVDNSELIVKSLNKKFLFGDTIEFPSKIDIKNIDNNAELKEIFNYNEKFEVEDVYALTIEYMENEIEGYNYDEKKNPYENFLEAAIISSIIESLNNSKCLVGGMWSSGSILSKPKKGKSSFEFFAKNVSEKNMFIGKFREKLNSYPDDFIRNTFFIDVPKFTSNRSEYSVKLEYRLLQIKYKIVLQQLCMQSAYMSDKDKLKFDKRVALLKDALNSYPAVIIVQ